MSWKKGIGVWISGFLTFLAGLNTIDAMLLMTLYDANLTVEVGIFRDVIGNIIGNIIGDVTVTSYLYMSITTTFIFLGLTSIIAHRKPSPDPTILKIITKVEENLDTYRRKLESTKIGLFAKMENNRMEEQELFDNIDINLANNRKEMFQQIKNQEKRSNAAYKDVSRAIEINLDNSRKEILGMLNKHGKLIEKVDRLTKQSVSIIKKQKMELTDMKARLEKIEEELTLPRPRLTSQSTPEAIKGIGPRLNKDLESIGIKNVDDLIRADPKLIAESTYASYEMLKRMQSRAQLLMIPGIDENDAELLEETRITTRRELADQDPVFLSRRIGEIAETYVKEGKFSKDEKPNIEEITFWIKQAKL